MTKKEKIAAICLILSTILIISSAIYTIYINKPIGYSFKIEKFLFNY